MGAAVSDGIDVRARAWVAAPRRRPPSLTIGDVTLVFPDGTTNEEAQAVLDEAKRLVAGCR